MATSREVRPLPWVNDTPWCSLHPDCWGNLAELVQAKARGRSDGDEPWHHSGRGSPGEGKDQEGIGWWRELKRLAAGTDSQGEKSREVGQRHQPHLLGVVG